MFSRRRQRLLIEEVLKASQGTSDPRTQLRRTAEVLVREAEADFCLFRIQAGDHGTVILQGMAGDKSLWPEGPELEELLSEVITGGSPLKWDHDKGNSGPFARSGLASVLVKPVCRRQIPLALVVVGFRPGKTLPHRFARRISFLSPTLAALARGIVVRLYQIRRNEIAGELLRISERLSSSPDVETCLSKIVRDACALTGASGAILRYLTGGVLRV
ncbi:MAG: hypothetical protein PVJ01_02340, partial [Pseudomonadota bacterium]